MNSSSLHIVKSLIDAEKTLKSSKQPVGQKSIIRAYSCSIFEKTFKSEKDLYSKILDQSKTVQKAKMRLQTLLNFVSYEQYCNWSINKSLTRAFHLCSKSNLVKYLVGENVTRFIKQCEEIGLLKCIDNSYSTGNYSKQYVYNKQVEKLIKNLCKSLGIEQTKSPNSYYKETHERVERIRKKNPDLKFDFTDKTLIDKRYTDEEIIAGVYNTNPELKEFDKIVEYLNDNYCTGNRKIKFNIHITRSSSGNVIKIGIRSTSFFCNLKKLGCKERIIGNRYREDELEKIFPHGYFEYDFCSSIYRIAYFMKNKIWLSPDVDIYEKIFGDMTDEERQACKTFTMQVFFNRSSKQHFARTSRLFKEHNAKLENKNDVKLIMEQTRSMLESIIGEFCGSKIFYYESCIYMLLLFELCEAGYDIVQIYDGFYCNDRSFIEFINSNIECIANKFLCMREKYENCSIAA